MTRRGTLLASGIVVLAALAAYHNSFSGPFILDDPRAIADNPSIKHFETAFSPPSDLTVGGRPLLNLTFALNYALGGMDVWGYHAFNLLIHILAGLTLFGVVRRTLREHPTSNAQRPTSKSNNPIFQGTSFTEATLLALAVAVIWIVHPLQTEAVTYISQRAESLMGLFYLLTLYCFIRGAENRRSGFKPDTSGINPDLQSERGDLSGSQLSTLNSRLPVLRSLGEGGWLLTSILACLLGVLSKELIATAPVIVLLYDRTFIAGSFREAWRLRWRYYLGLASTWLVLACLTTGLHQRGVGFDQGVTWRNYALTSCRSAVLYLKLAVWPHPLVFDYGFDVVHHVTEVLPYMLVLVALIAGLTMALWRWPVVGFAGAWFFAILAPTTSVVPVALQPTAEHRVYLSLAAVIGLFVLGLYRWIGRCSLIIFVAVAAGLGWLSIRRNEDYRSELAIWQNTVEKCPGSARARFNLGVTVMSLSRLQEAIADYRAALQIKPDFAEAHNNLGLALAAIPGGLSEAIAEYRAALRIKPDYADAHYDLAIALMKEPGQFSEAIAEYRAAIRVKPGFPEAHYNLGNALMKVPGRFSEAIAEYEAALRINPDYAEAHNNLGGALSIIPGRIPDAIAQFQAAVRIKPDYAEAHKNLGMALSGVPGRLPDAIAELETALRINSNYRSAQAALDRLQAKQ